MLHNAVIILKGRLNTPASRNSWFPRSFIKFFLEFSGRCLFLYPAFPNTRDPKLLLFDQPNVNPGNKLCPYMMTGIFSVEVKNDEYCVRPEEVNKMSIIAVKAPGKVRCNRQLDNPE